MNRCASDHGLPEYRTSLVGRDDDLSRLEQALLGGERLVTLTGTGGAGKTRLACELGRRMVDLFEGVHFADLAGARSLDDVCERLAGALGLASVSTDSDRIGAALASLGRVLIIADNFEQVVTHAASSLSRWVSAAKDATFIVTSRQILRLSSELVFQVEPLSTEAPADATSAALELLFARVERIRAGLTPALRADRGAMRLAQRLVQALDGLPLSIELAAPRVAWLGVEQALDALSEGLESLSLGSRDAPPRQRTLRDTIAWSWELLGPDARAALAQCAVFRGGFSMKAAESVLRLEPSGEAASIAALVLALREQSLLHAIERSALGPGSTGDLEGRLSETGGTRFELYSVIREFAAEKLRELGLDESTRARHAAYYLGDGRARSETADHHNVLAAIDHELEANSPEGDTRALEGLLVLSPWPAGRSGLAQGVGAHELRARLDRALQSGRGPLTLRADALAVRGTLCRFAGMLEDSARDHQRGLELAREAEDPRREAEALRTLSMTRYTEGQVEESRRLLESALALFRSLGDRDDEARCLSSAALLALAEAEPDRALLCATESRERHHARGNRFGEALATDLAALCALDLGDVEGAKRSFEIARAAHRSLGNTIYEGFSLCHLGEILHHQSELERALETQAEVLRMADGLRHPRLRSFALGRAGIAQLELRDLDASLSSLARACDVARAIGDRRLTGLFLSYRGAAELSSGERVRGARSLDEASALLSAGRDPFRAVVECQRAHEHLARIRPSLPADVQRGAEDGSSLAAARALVDAAEVSDVRSAELRLAVRIARAWMAQAEARLLAAPTAAATSTEERAPTLLVGPDAAWFELAETGRVSLERRRALRSLLGRLLEAHRSEPGRAVAWDILLEAGWPAEKVGAVIGFGRVRSAVFMLRRLGLERILETRDNGYLLAARVEIRGAPRP